MQRFLGASSCVRLAAWPQPRALRRYWDAAVGARRKLPKGRSSVNDGPTDEPLTSMARNQSEPTPAATSRAGRLHDGSPDELEAIGHAHVADIGRRGAHQASG